MKRVLVTGGSGFVGGGLLKALTDYEVVCVGRGNPTQEEGRFFKANIDSATDYADALRGVDTVIHCAARAHIMNDGAEDPLIEYRKINTDGSLNLARQAARLGVRRFIFISSIKVNGEQTYLGSPFTADGCNMPTDPYALSKYEAEAGLKAIAGSTDLEIVIIRPPLVYGPGVKANFLSMLKLASKGLPLPFGGMTANLRSLVFIDNLVDLIVTCIEHSGAKNETFLVSDNYDLSTAELFRRLSICCGKSGFLLPVPTILFELGFKLIGKSDFYQRLCGSLQVDINDTMDKLDWKPPYSVDDGLYKTASHYLENKV